MVDGVLDDDSVSSFSTLNDGESEASLDNESNDEQSTASSSSEDATDNQDLGSELSFEGTGSNNGSRRSSALSDDLFSDEDHADASDTDERNSLLSWDDQELLDQSDQPRLCSDCRDIPFNQIWGGTPFSMKWTGDSTCPVCAILGSFIPPDSDGEPQSIMRFCPDCSLSYRRELLSCQRPVDLLLKRYGKYDIIV